MHDVTKILVLEPIIPVTILESRQTYIHTSTNTLNKDTYSDIRNLILIRNCFEKCTGISKAQWNQRSDGVDSYRLLPDILNNSTAIVMISWQ